MGLWKIHKGRFLTAQTGGLSLLTKKGRESERKANRDLRKRHGLTSKSKFVRQLKRRLGFGKKDAVVSSQPTSASSVGYQYQPRTLSQLTGGV